MAAAGAPAPVVGLVPGPGPVPAGAAAVPVLPEADSHQAWLEALGEEFAGDKCTVCLISISRVLAARLAAGDLRDVTLLDREQVLASAWDSFENPLPAPRGSRPREAKRHFLNQLWCVQP